jgi:hypothetical protein
MTFVLFVIQTWGYNCVCVGNSRWVHAMEWSGQQKFVASPEVPFVVNGSEAGVLKSHGALTFLKVCIPVSLSLSLSLSLTHIHSQPCTFAFLPTNGQWLVASLTYLHNICTINRFTMRVTWFLWTSRRRH